MEYVLLVVGFILLIKGADCFVDGSSSVAKKLKVPSLIIGMTIVAMGTSLPECSVSITASMSGQNGLSIGNAVGSNIFNLMVVCGLCALFAPLPVSQGTLKKEFPFSIMVALLLLALGSFGLSLGRLDGGVLLIVFVVFLLWMIMSAKKARSNAGDAEEEYEILPVWQCVIYILGGIVAIKYGGDFVVDSASVIAKSFGMSDTLVGMTIVAFGTSLPELVTSVIAARKNEVDMAIGNVIGSNIFNILLVLGVAAAISPITFIMDNIIDTIALVVMSIMVLIFAWTKQKIERLEGAVMLLVYAGYMVYMCMR